MRGDKTRRKSIREILKAHKSSKARVSDPFYMY